MCSSEGENTIDDAAKRRRCSGCIRADLGEEPGTVAWLPGQPAAQRWSGHCGRLSGCAGPAGSPVFGHLGEGRKSGQESEERSVAEERQGRTR